jgi:hypothetical protein
VPIRSSASRILFLSLIFLFGVLSPSVSAQDSGTPEATPESDRIEFALAPVGEHPDGFFKDLEVSPGGSIDLAIVVMNLGTVPLKLDTFKSNAINTTNGGFTTEDAAAEPSEATTWVDFPAQTIELEAGAAQEISFSVTVPADAQPGQYISALSAKTAEALPMPGTDSLDYTLSSALTVGILVPGEMTHAFSLGEPEILPDREVRTLSIPVQNEGNYLVRPAGDLVIADADGKDVLTAPIEMGSVYAGLGTTIEVLLPEQMAAGDYTVSFSMTDPESGATDEITNAAVTIDELADPTGVSLSSATIEPNADEISFANVDITLDNGGQEIPASNVTLEVMHDGVAVESFPLATNQVLLNGENTFTARYIPAGTWESGEYTFRIVVSAVDPQGGQQTILLDDDLDATIVVP